MSSACSLKGAHQRPNFCSGRQTGDKIGEKNAITVDGVASHMMKGKGGAGGEESGELETSPLRSFTWMLVFTRRCVDSREVISNPR